MSVDDYRRRAEEILGHSGAVAEYYRDDGDGTQDRPALDRYQDHAERQRGISLEGDDGKKKSQATILIEIAERWEVFHDADQNGYAVIDDGTRKVMPIRSKAFRSLLSGEFFTLTGKGCNGTAISDALATIEARAVFAGPEYPVYIRVARTENCIYLDLCDEQWRAIEISPDGWRIVETPPVYFIRKPGMAVLPMPIKGGSATDIRKFLNINDGQLELVIGWMLGALRGKGPYPVMVLQGEQGTGKSTTSRVLRSFVDPSTTPLRSPPREVRDLLVSATNNHLVLLDNLSGLNPELSDCLCRFATGGGLDARALFTDMDQVLIDIQRPVLVNGIDDIATRPDLSERSLILNLPVIDPTKRRDERSFWAGFDEAKPGIMGGLLDALSCALRRESSVKLARKPRMADFAIWVTAAEPALGWKDGAFMQRYDAMQDNAVIEGIEASPVGSALLDLLSDKDEWLGTPTTLLRDLEVIAGNAAKSKAWPKSLKGLKNILQRLAPSLRRMGITIEDSRTRTGRFYKIHKAPIYPSQPSQPSQGFKNNGLGVTDSVTDRTDVTDNRHSVTDNYPEPSRGNPTAGAGCDACDTCDGYFGDSPKDERDGQTPRLSGTPAQPSIDVGCRPVADRSAANPDSAAGKGPPTDLRGKWEKPAFRIVLNDERGF